jgi:phenylalanyl-tRNA synthetase alpha chain
VDQTIQQLLEQIGHSATPDQVRERRRHALAITRRAFQDLANLDPAERRRRGQDLNRAKAEIERLADERLRLLEMTDRHADTQRVPDLPVAPAPIGQVHPTIAVLRRMNGFFRALGFDVADGPEIESDWYNFAALNLPPEHPAREMHDTIYLRGSELLLRTHTSSVEIRALEQRKPPLRVIVPGKAYRSEAVNATNNYMFFQYEGLVVQRDISMAHLRSVLGTFLQYMFGAQIQARFRAKYYPQVEPGLGVDLQCQFCSGSGCAVCKGKGWIEILGGGMVHPNALAAVGIDWHAYSGFAFGMGLDRLVMSAMGIADIRQLYGPRMSYIGEV